MSNPVTGHSRDSVQSEAGADPAACNVNRPADHSSAWFVRWQWPLVTIAAAFALDQGTKRLVLAHKPPSGQHLITEVIPGLLNVVLVHNTGAAFGVASGQGIVLAGLSVLIFALLVWRFHELAAGLRIKAFGISLVLGGILGNLIDRLLYEGAVIDFVDLYHGQVHWPAFNVADAAITVGVTLFVVFTLFGGSAQGGEE